jgi:hypothetical protein
MSPTLLGTLEQQKELTERWVLRMKFMIMEPPYPRAPVTQVSHSQEMTVSLPFRKTGPDSLFT